MKSRSYCFTWNNPQDREPFDYEALDCTYLLVGHEVGTKNGVPHHQGYVRFKNQVSPKSVKKKLPSGCHIEVCHGTPQQNIQYCSKDERIVIEKGTRPKMGKRNDIIAVKEVIASGGGMKDVIECTNSYQAMRCGELILKYTEKPRTTKPIVKWYHGPTGSGKTRKAFEESTDPWISARNLKWWDGYDAHKHVIIDDFRKDFCTFHELLRILDRYPYRIEHKGGSRQLLAEQIIITCPFPPDEVYSNREDVNQLLRRIDEVQEIDYQEED